MTEDRTEFSPVLRTIDLLGDRVTLAILRDAFVDRIHRFSDWEQRTGAPPAVLSSRLQTLVNEGLMDRVPRSDGHDRSDYLLTELGLDTWQLLVAIWGWLREWSPAGWYQPELVHNGCGHRGVPEVICLGCGAPVRGSNAQLIGDVDSLALRTGANRRRSTRTPPLSRADLQFTEVMEAIGDRWSALVTGLALSGVRRFRDFRAVLGISPTTLTERLTRLTAAGIVEKVDDGREYRLTPRGRALFGIFAFQIDWAGRAFPDTEPEMVLSHLGCASTRLDPGLRCRGCGEVLSRADVRFDRAPGAPAH